MSKDLSGIELPRLVKKPGDYKRVNTIEELEAALKDGWSVKTPSAFVSDSEPTTPDAPDEPFDAGTSHKGSTKKK